MPLAKNPRGNPFNQEVAVDINQISRTNRLSIQQLEQMTEIELSNLKALYDDDIARISSQLENAQADLHSSGEYADANWYASAKSAKRFKGQASQAIQNELSRRRKGRRSNQHFVDALLEAMGELLTPELKSQVVALAKSKTQ